MSAYIYLVTNLETGTEYIGYTNNPRDRWRVHDREALQRDSTTYFHRAIRKYGWENFAFDVIFEHDDEEWTLNVMEPYFIDWYDTFNNGYNLTRGGDGCIGREVSKETRRKISEAHRGRTHTEETRRKLSEAAKGKKKTPEHAANISKGKTGSKRKPFSEEHRRKLSEAAKRDWKKRKKETPSRRSERGP
jgi:group I intron endonuclease